jgi:uncharacterized protein (TIGR03083 family)
MDLGAMYRASRLRIGELVDPEVAPRPVPATPLWNVHDVVAHVAGIAEDSANDNMAGAPSREWTDDQVARGASKSVGQLFDQWAGHAAPMEGFLSTPAGVNASAAVVDVWTHEADLRHALGLPAEPDDEFLGWIAPEMLDSFHRAVAERGLPPVEVTGEPFDIWRGRLGRRTPDEIAALDWSGDPVPYLDTWFIFGRRTTPLGERCR